MNSNQSQQSTVGIAATNAGVRVPSPARTDFGLPRLDIALLGHHSLDSKPQSLQAIGIAPLGGRQTDTAPLGGAPPSAMGIAPLANMQIGIAPSAAPTPSAAPAPIIARAAEQTEIAPADSHDPPPCAESPRESAAPANGIPALAEPAARSDPPKEFTAHDETAPRKPSATRSDPPKGFRARDAIAPREPSAPTYSATGSVRPTAPVPKASVAARPSQPPLAQANSALARLIDKLVLSDAPWAVSSATNATSSGFMLPSAKSVTHRAEPIDDEAGWDLDEPTKPDAVVPPAIAVDEANKLDSASPRSECGAEEAAQAEPQAAEPTSAHLAVTDAPPPAEIPSIAGELEHQLDEDAQLMALIAAAKARADDVPPPPQPQAPTSVPPQPINLVTAANTQETAEELNDDLDEDAQLMALIAAAKARADDVPPPPQAFTSAPPPAAFASTATDIQSTSNESDHELDEDAQLMALIAAAKARADDVPPPPPPQASKSAPPPAAFASTATDIQSPAEALDRDLDEDAQLMALIAAAKARADDVPPPPPPA